MMNELTERQEATLIECLETVDAGGDLDACLSQYPQDAEALRPYLAVRARMLTMDQPEPTAPAYQAGRQALVDALAHPSSAGKRWPLIAAFGVRWGRPAEALVSACRRATSLAVGGFGRIESPLARAAAVTALFFVLGGGALGAAATVGFQPAREVLSTLRIIEDPGHGGNVGSDSDDGGQAGSDDGGLTTDDGRAAGDEGGVAPPGSEVEEMEADEHEGDDPDDGDSDGGSGRDGDDHAAEPDLEAKPRDEEPMLDDSPRHHDEPDDNALEPRPRRDEPEPTPRPNVPQPTPKPDEPIEIPEPDEPTEIPEPDGPAPSVSDPI